MAGLQEVLQIILKVIDQGSGEIEKVSGEMEKLSKTARETQRSLDQIEAFKKLKKETLDSMSAFKDAQAEVKRLAQAMKNAEGDTSALQKQFDAAKKNAKALKSEYEDNNKALSGLRTSLRSAGVDVTKLGTEQGRLRSQLDQTRNALKELSTQAKARDLLGVRSFSEIQKEIKKVEQAYKDLAKSGKLTGEELKRAQEAAKQKTAELTDEMTGAEKASERLGSAMGTLVKSMAVLGAIAFPTVQAAEFERKMAEVKAISGATEEEFQGLTDIARKMGEETEFTAMQSAEGLKMLAMAGLDAKESIGALPAVLQLAQAGVVELGDAADIITNIMTGFGIEVEKLGEVNDILVQTFTHTNSTITELGTAFSYVGPIAAALGADFGELAATIGALHNAGLKGSMAGTALRGALDNLFNPTKEEAALLKELEGRLGGVSLKLRDSSGNFIGFTEVVRQLQQANLSGAEALELFGQRAGPGMAALVSIGAEALEDLNRLNEQAGGRASQIAKVIHENTVGAWKGLQSASESLSIEIGNKLLPILTQLIQFVTSVTTAMTQWARENPQLSAGIVQVTAAVTAAIVALNLFKVGMLAVNVAVRTAAPLNTGLSASLGILSGSFTAAAASVGIFKASLLAVGAIFLAAIGGWMGGRLIGALTVPWDEGGRSVDEFVQIGYAKLGTFFNWLTGESNESNQMVIDGINEEAQARKAGAELARLESEKATAMQQGLKTATADVTAEIEKTNKAWETAGTKLEMVQKEYDRFVSTASDSLDRLGSAIQKTLTGMWANTGSGEGIAKLQADLDALSRAYELNDQQRLLKTTAIENQISAARVAVIQSTAVQAMALLEQENTRRKQLLDTQLATELAVIERTATSEEQAVNQRVSAEKKHADAVSDLSQQTMEKKKQSYEQARQALEKELDAGLAKEKQIADEIKSLQESVAQARMSAEDKVRALQQKGMTEYAAYQDQVAQVQEKIAKAGELAATDTEASINMFKEAQNMAAGLGQEVTEGEKIVVSQQNAIQTAIGLVQQAQTGMETAANARTAALSTALDQTKQNTDAIAQALEKTKTDIDALSAKYQQGLDIQVTLKTEEFDKAIAKMEENREILVNVKGEFSDVSAKLGELNKQKLEIMQNVEFQVNAKYDQAIAGVKATLAELEKIKPVYTTTIEIKGKASPEKPISETIADVEGKLNGMYDVAEQGASSTITMDTDPAKTAMAELGAEAEKTKAVISEPATMDIDIDPAKAALQELADEAYKSAVAAEKIRIELQNLSTSTRQFTGGMGMTDAIHKNLEGARAQVSKFRAEWQSLKAQVGSGISGTVNLRGKASPERPLMETFANVTSAYENFRKSVTSPVSANVKFGNIKDSMQAAANVRVSAGGLGAGGLGGLKDYGKIDVNVGGKGGSVIGKPDVLKWLKESLTDEKRMGYA